VLTWVLGLPSKQGQSQASLDIFVAIDGRSNAGKDLRKGRRPWAREPMRGGCYVLCFKNQGVPSMQQPPQAQTPSPALTPGSFMSWLFPRQS
jgi:hypothetical protein